MTSNACTHMKAGIGQLFRDASRFMAQDVRSNVEDEIGRVRQEAVLRSRSWGAVEKRGSPMWRRPWLYIMADYGLEKHGWTCSFCL